MAREINGKKIILRLLLLLLVGLLLATYIAQQAYLRSLPVVEKVNASGADARKNADFQLFSMLLDDTNPLVGKTPRTSGLREKYDALVLAVQRNDEYLDQDTELTFQPGDLVWLVGDPKNLPK